MILVIDTSSAMSAIALLRPEGGVAGEHVGASGPVFGLADSVRAMREGRPLSVVAVFSWLLCHRCRASYCATSAGRIGHQPSGGGGTFTRRCT